MAWRKEADGEQPHLDPLDNAAIHAWNMAGGMEWSAIPMVAAILEIDDIEGLVIRMTALRDGLK